MEKNLHYDSQFLFRLPISNQTKKYLMYYEILLLIVLIVQFKINLI